MPRRWTDLNTLKQLFYKKAETLGTDGGDAGYTITHGVGSAAYGLYTLLRTGNVANNQVYSYGEQYLNLRNKLPTRVTLTRVIFETELRLAQTANCAVSVGFTSETTLEPAVPSAQIFYDSSVGANFRCRSYDAAEEETNTDVAADTALHTFQISREAAKVQFYIDGTLKATHTAQVPTPGLVNATNKATVLAKTLAAATKDVNYNYVIVWVE